MAYTYKYDDINKQNKIYEDTYNEDSYSEEDNEIVYDLLDNEIIKEKLIQNDNLANYSSCELRNILLFYMINNDTYSQLIKNPLNIKYLTNLITKDKYYIIIQKFESFFSNNTVDDYNYIINILQWFSDIKSVPESIKKYIISNHDIERIYNILYKYKIPTSKDDMTYIMEKYVIDENYITSENYNSENIEFNNKIIKERIFTNYLINYIKYISIHNDYVYDIDEILNTIFSYDNYEHFIQNLYIELIIHTILDKYPEIDIYDNKQVMYHIVNFIMTEGIDYSFRLCDMLYKIVSIIKKYKLFNNDVLNTFYNLVYFGKMLINIHMYINYNKLIKFDIIDDKVYDKREYVDTITEAILNNLYFFDENDEDEDKCKFFIFMYYKYNNVLLDLPSYISDFNMFIKNIINIFIKDTNIHYEPIYTVNNYLIRVDDIENKPADYFDRIFDVITDIVNEYIQTIDVETDHEYLCILSKLCYILIFYINYYTIKENKTFDTSRYNLLDKFFKILNKLYEYEDESIYNITMLNIMYLYDEIDKKEDFIKIMILYDNYINHTKLNFNSKSLNHEFNFVSDLGMYLGFMNDIFFYRFLQNNEYIMDDKYNEQLEGITYDQYDEGLEMLRRIKNYVYLYNSNDD